jgi:hypothetical protein
LKSERENSLQIDSQIEFLIMNLDYCEEFSRT